MINEDLRALYSACLGKWAEDRSPEEIIIGLRQSLDSWSSNKWSIAYCRTTNSAAIIPKNSYYNKKALLEFSEYPEEVRALFLTNYIEVIHEDYRRYVALNQRTSPVWREISDDKRERFFGVVHRVLSRGDLRCADTAFARGCRNQLRNSICLHLNRYLDS